MFSNLRQSILQLNTDVKTVANCEKAKKLRKKLLSIGLPLAIGGFGGVLICFILFTVFSIQSVENMSGFNVGVLIPFFLIIPCALAGGIGAMLLSLAMQITLTAYVSETVDETLKITCPRCQNVMEANAKFCGKCGKAFSTICPSCQAENDNENKYCSQCGQPL